MRKSLLTSCLIFSVFCSQASDQRRLESMASKIYRNFFRNPDAWLFFEDEFYRPFQESHKYVDSATEEGFIRSSTGLAWMRCSKNNRMDYACAENAIKNKLFDEMATLLDEQAERAVVDVPYTAPEVLAAIKRDAKSRLLDCINRSSHLGFHSFLGGNSSLVTYYKTRLREQRVKISTQETGQTTCALCTTKSSLTKMAMCPHFLCTNCARTLVESAEISKKSTKPTIA